MTTLKDKQLNQVIEQLKAMSDSSLQIYHNNYCSDLSYEDIIYDNDEYTINEQFNTPFDVLRSIGHYNLSDDYFYFHNGNLVSFNYLTAEDSPITFSELAQWIIDNELFSDYDITITTLDDILASIEDNITDDKNMLDRAVIHLEIHIMSDYVYSPSDVMDVIYNYDYEQLKDIITHLNISYE